ncbi:MAG: sugar phosphate isomerase/epimerase [Thermoguttaceae bacterium]|nr:sugar phosphate isomerase/epimerase [Thermoguttaceae bacterium]MDW8039007.1 sugar phosphate isomerase/epimerase family protein [Thermoguttaceae bacterium]
MPQLKLSVDLAELRQPFKQALDTAAQLGVQAVQIEARGELDPAQLSQTGIRHIRKMLEDWNLRVSAVRFRPTLSYYNLDRLEARIEATQRAMELAYKLGAGLVVGRIGRIPPPDSSEHRLLTEVVTDLGRYGQRVGAMLATETGSEPGSELARFIQQLPEGSLGVDLNPANLVVENHSIEEAIETLGKHVLCVQATDALRDAAAGTAVRVELGRGNVDYRSLLAGLDGWSYQGYWTLQPAGGGDPKAELLRSIRFLRSL